MKQEESKREFKAYLRRLYGSQARMADELSVTPNTITNWVQRDPTPMLGHAPKIVSECDTTHTELMAEVLYLKAKLERGET